jgi:hypothetical protein
MIVDPSSIVPNSLRLWDNAVPISGRIVGALVSDAAVTISAANEKGLLRRCGLIDY